MSILRPGVGLRGQTLLIVEMVLGPLLVKEGHEMGEKGTTQDFSIGADAQYPTKPIDCDDDIGPDRVILREL